MMKKLFCLLLTLCTLFCLSACQKEEPEQPDDGFPTTVETIYPVVAGDRIPFQTIGSYSGGTDMIIHSAAEALVAFHNNSPQLDDIEIKKIAAVDFERYAVLCIAITSRDSLVQSSVKELVVRNGELVAVYCSSHVDESAPPADSEASKEVSGTWVGPSATVLVIRKNAFDFSKYEDPLNLNIKVLMTYENYPDRVDEVENKAWSGFVQCPINKRSGYMKKLFCAVLCLAMLLTCGALLAERSTYSPRRM